MRIGRGIGGLGLLLISVVSAGAAPATSDQAISMQHGLERYIGSGSGGTDPVSVKPDNDRYRIDIDLRQALHGLSSFGLVVEPATYTMFAAPLDGGTWRVTSDGIPRVTVRHGEDSYSVVVNGMTFDGIFDPRIPGFQTSAMAYDSMSVAVVGRQGGTQTREIDRGRQTSTATLNGDGVVNLQVTQSNDGFTQDVTLDKAAPGGASGRLSLKSTATAASLAVADFHTRALADLWAFFVAHSDKPVIATDQAELKDLLRRALPLFDTWTQSGSAERLTVETPVGPFTVAHLGGMLKTTGLVADGRVESELRYDGATYPSGLVPGWADGLIPTLAVLRESVSGFHLDAAARHAIDAFDVTAPKPFTPEVLEQLRQQFGPLDRMVVTIAPTHLESRDLKVDLDGEIHLAQGMPDVRVTIHAAGLDKALQNIQAAAAGDPQASQLVAVLVLAKGLGKAEPDGSLTWAVTKQGDGGILVNGLTLPGMGK